MRSFYYYYFIIYKKIRRDLDLTCIKELCDPAMILEKEKKITHLSPHTRTHNTRKASDSSFSSPHLWGGGEGIL